jgi:hypothetical protein
MKRNRVVPDPGRETSFKKRIWQAPKAVLAHAP